MYMPQQRHRVGARVSWISLTVNLLLAVIKGVSGVIFGSASLIADALHSVSDALSTVGVLVGLHVSHQPPDADHPYGHGKAEHLAALFLSLTLGGASILMIRTAILKAADPTPVVPGAAALVAAAISILAKEGLFSYIKATALNINSDLLLADAWHHRTDALSSLAALLGIGVARLGWPLADPVAGMVVSVLVIRVAVGILLKSASALMDSQPDRFSEESQAIRDIIDATGSVHHVDDLRMREYGGALIVDLEVSIDGDVSLEHAHHTATRLSRTIEKQRPGVWEVFVHINAHPMHEKHVSDWENAPVE